MVHDQAQNQTSQIDSRDTSHTTNMAVTIDENNKYHLYREIISVRYSDTQLLIILVYYSSSV